MLTRIISGAVGVVIVAVVLYFHSTILLPIAVAAMIAVMLFELPRAVKLHKCLPILIAAELCGVSVPFIFEISYKNIGSDIEGGDKLPAGDHFLAQYGVPCSVIVSCAVLAAAFVIFLTWLKKHKEIRYEQVFFTLAAMVLVPQAMTTMVRLDRESGDVLFVILGLCGAWVADTGAYFTGVAFGKHKLCPEISPKKTIEGFIGGILVTGIVFGAIGAFSGHDDLAAGNFFAMALIGMVCAVVGTVGDLSASMVKRQIGFKDYGKIMPGHGGLMDRFDSVLFVLPAFYFTLKIIELFS